MSDTESTLTHFRLELDDDGVMVVWMDVVGEKVNTLSSKVADDLRAVVDRIEKDSVSGFHKQDSLEPK